MDLQLNKKVKNEDSQQALVLWLGALLSYQLGAGHSCVNLERLPSPLFDLSENEGYLQDKYITLEALALLNVDALSMMLRSSPVVCSRKQTSDNTELSAPLCLEGSRLYLYRYWRYEHEVALYLKYFNTDICILQAD